MDPASVLVTRITELAVGRSKPLIVALDGRSAAGKSALAGEVAPLVDGKVIDGDDFYSGGTAAVWDAMSAPEKVNHCIDWKRQRPVLEALSRGEAGAWFSYDWATDDGRLASQSTTCEPAPVVVLEGVYSARPELADLTDLRVLYDAPAEMHRERLIFREGEDYRVEWNARWDEAEQWYFGVVMHPEAFDVVIAAT